MQTLGQVLKATREGESLTLREVEVATGISNAYLSQLENDKIKKPSASVLYKLSDLYKIGLEVLLTAAGIIEKRDGEPHKANAELEREIAFLKEELSAEEEQQVIAFIKFLRSQNRNGAAAV